MTKQEKIDAAWDAYFKEMQEKMAREYEVNIVMIMGALLKKGGML